jgi:hypothetical protein
MKVLVKSGDRYLGWYFSKNWSVNAAQLVTNFTS